MFVQYFYKFKFPGSNKGIVRKNIYYYHINGCGMGPLLVLVSPCFRENVVVTCKIGSFFCLKLKQIVIVFFWKWNFKMALIWKKKWGFFYLLFTFFSYQGKVTKFLEHISHSHTYMYFAHPIDFCCLTALPILKQKIRIYQAWFLFGVIPGVDSYSRHFGTINK